MKRFAIIFLIFMVVTVLFAGKTGSRIEEKTYNWESGSTEFVSDSGMDNCSVPNLIDYQGKITDNNNNPITTPVSIVFAIYSADTGGTALWTETHSSVTPVDGLVHVLLGSIPATPFPGDLFNGSDRWLGIEIGNDGEMTPRLRIVSVPYAIYANDSDNLDGHDSSYFMTASTEFGIDDLTDGKTGGLSVFLGSGSGSSNTGSNNAFLGVDAGAANTSGLANTYIGRGSGYYNTAGNYNTFLGYYSGLNNSGSSNVFMGGWSGMNATGSNKLYIENSNTNTPLIYGEFDNDKIVINGEFQATGITRDSSGDAGTSGQVFSSTVTGTDWIDAGGTGDITAVTAGTGLTGGGDTGDVTLDVDVPLNLSGNISYPNSVIKGENTGTGSAIYGHSEGYYGGYFTSDLGNDNTHVIHAEYTGSSTSNDPIAVYGESNYTNHGYGGYFVGGLMGVYAAVAPISAETFYGVYGKVAGGYGGTHYGVRGEVQGASGTNYGVYGKASGTGINWAGYFNGNVCVIGEFHDSSSDAGTSGQVLSTTGTGTDWINTEIDDLADAKADGSSIFLGSSAGRVDDGSNLNVSLGNSSSFNNIDGTNNVCIGSVAGFNGTSYNKNVYVGYSTGYSNQGDNNTFLGYRAGSANQNTSNSIFIGYDAGNYNSPGSNILFIENSNSATPLIYGDFTDGNELVKINGDFETTGTATIGNVLHLTPMSSLPTSPSNGDIFVGTDNHIYCYLGGSWKQLDN